MVSECHSLSLPLAEPALHSIIRQDSALRLGIWASKYTWCSKAWDHSSCEWTEGRRSAWVDKLIGYLLWFYSTPLSTSHLPEVIYMIIGPRPSPCFCAFVLLCIIVLWSQTEEYKQGRPWNEAEKYMTPVVVGPLLSAFALVEFSV